MSFCSVYENSVANLLHSFLYLSIPRLCVSSSSSSPVPGYNNHNNRPHTPQLPTTVFPPTSETLHLFEDEDQYYPEPPSLNVPLLTVTGPGGAHYSSTASTPGSCFSPQPTRDAYQMEPDEETAAVLNQVGLEWRRCNAILIISLL